VNGRRLNLAPETAQRDFGPLGDLVDGADGPGGFPPPWDERGPAPPSG
jgi:hypothetical protein